MSALAVTHCTKRFGFMAVTATAASPLTETHVAMTPT